MLIVAVGGLLIDSGINRVNYASLGLVLVFALSNAVLPFVLGPEQGLEKAREAGKPALLFYAASW